MGRLAIIWAFVAGALVFAGVYAATYYAVNPRLPAAVRAVRAGSLTVVNPIGMAVALGMGLWVHRSIMRDAADRRITRTRREQREE